MVQVENSTHGHERGCSHNPGRLKTLPNGLKLLQAMEYKGYEAQIHFV